MAIIVAMENIMKKSVQAAGLVILAVVMVTASAEVTAPVRAQDAAPLQAAKPLPKEPIPNVEKMPKQLPEHLIFAHDLAFFSITAGRVALIDIAADTRRVIGMIGAAQAATFGQSARRGELYVAETFFERGTRGKQTDVLTIYDVKTLEPVGEVVWPTKKRYQVIGEKAALQLTRNEKFALVFNFTPAQSVTVIDLAKREIVNEINLPGCMLTYPYGRSGFATLCGDGSLLAMPLDRKGQVDKKKIKRTGKFNDIDDNPLFMDSVTIGKTSYFTTFKGDIQPIRLSGRAPKVLESWKLQSSLPQAAANPRPAGYQILAKDANGRLYVLMRANAKDGEHKHPGSQVWVIDPEQQVVMDIIQLETDGIAIEITQTPNPLMAVVNETWGQIDVYDVATKERVRSIGGWGAGTFLGLYAGR